MNKKMKLLSYILCSAILLGLFVPTPVFASENVYTEVMSTTNGAIQAIQYTSDDFSSEITGIYPQMLFDDEFKEGDVRVLGILDEGKLCVEVIDVTESSTSTYTNDISTTSKTFLLYITNFWGVKTYLVRVTAECSWIPGSKITAFKCIYATMHSGVTCSWNSDYSTESDLQYTCALDMTYSGASTFIIFGATLYLDLQTLVLDCSADSYD